jgi:hypothetical protein
MSITFISVGWYIWNECNVYKNILIIFVILFGIQYMFVIFAED